MIDEAWLVTTESKANTWIEVFTFIAVSLKGRMAAAQILITFPAQNYCLFTWLDYFCACIWDNRISLSHLLYRSFTVSIIPRKGKLYTYSIYSAVCFY